MENPPSPTPSATPPPPKDPEKSGNIVGRVYMKVEDLVGNAIELMSARKQTTALGKIVGEMENIPPSAKDMHEAYRGIFQEFDHLAGAINGSPFWADPSIKLESDTVAQQARSLERAFHHLTKDEQGLPLVLEHMRLLKRSMENQIAVLSQQRERLNHRSSRTRWIMRTVLGGVLLSGSYGTFKYFSAPSEEAKQAGQSSPTPDPMPTESLEIEQERLDAFKDSMKNAQDAARKKLENLLREGKKEKKQDTADPFETFRKAKPSPSVKQENP